MKKILLCAFLMIAAISLVSCALPHKFPEDGIWYCEELGISFEANDKNGENGRWYYSDTEYHELGYVKGSLFPEMTIEYITEEDAFHIYGGVVSYKDDKVYFTMYSMIDPVNVSSFTKTTVGTYIVIEGKEYVFEEIESYDEVKYDPENNMIVQFFNEK